jgi:hypothetical protein
LLGGLVSAAKQEKDDVTRLCKINPVTGAPSYTQFGYATIQRPVIAGIAEREAVDACTDSRPCLPILQRVQPFGKWPASIGRLINENRTRSHVIVIYKLLLPKISLAGILP